MRKRLWPLLLLLATIGADLGWSEPCRAQSLGGRYEFMEMSQSDRTKIKRRQRMIAGGVLGCAGGIAIILITLNLIEKKSERRKIMRQYAERMENGMV
jgi:hypothetical protein